MSTRTASLGPALVRRRAGGLHALRRAGRGRLAGRTRFSVPLTLLGMAYVVGLAIAMDRTSYDVWGALVIAPVLFGLALPLAARAARNEDDPVVARMIMAALTLKFVGALARYAVAFEVYGGSADAQGYHGAGTKLAAALWNDTFWVTYAEEVPELVGTEFIRLLTGLLYIVTGPTKLGGFLVYAWISFLGLYLCYRAFRVAFPGGDHRRYAILLFFLPSLLYWPSSIGKEAWMMFTIGVCSYGAARLLRRLPGGFPILIAGLVGTALVRPHITLVVFASLFTAYLLRKAPSKPSPLGPLGKAAGVVAMLVVGAVVLGQVASFFGLEQLDSAGVEAALERTEGQSSTGGSEFTAARPNTPAEFPMAVMSVLFRPFPWEAGNVQGLIAASETVVLMLLFLFGGRRLLSAPVEFFRTPYVAFCITYLLLFSFAFSSVGNFGIMTRQRVQVFPFVLVLLALPLRPPTPPPARVDPPMVRTRT